MTQHRYVNESAEVYDAIVVGSGITGGWAAKELCEKGLKTLMVERGRVVEHRKDYTTEAKPPWEYPNRMKVAKKLIDEEYPIQQQCYAFHDGTKHFFSSDKDYPYHTEPDAPFSWIRANQLGGKSLLWHRQSYRMSPLILKPMPKTVMAMTGLFAMKTWRLGMTMWSVLWGSAAMPTGCHNCPTVFSNRRLR